MTAHWEFAPGPSHVKRLALWRTDPARPRHRRGSVKRFRGLILCVKLENPKGLRIDRAFTLDGPLERDKTYPVGFITAQSVPKGLGRNRSDLEIRAVAALEDWFRTPEWQDDSGVSGADKFVVM